MKLRALLVDNYDSFTYNLARYFNELSVEIDIIKNDAMPIEHSTMEDIDFIVISPGPGKPTQAGISLSLIKQYLDTIPILGICLGHQCLAHALNGTITPASQILHGKTSQITHNYDPLFTHIPQQFNVTRYHSLSIDIQTLHTDFAVCAWSQNEIMVIKHLHRLTYGVQFHPEAFLTEHGHQLLDNFITLVKLRKHEQYTEQLVK